MDIFIALIINRLQYIFYYSYYYRSTIYNTYVLHGNLSHWYILDI